MWIGWFPAVNGRQGGEQKTLQDGGSDGKRFPFEEVVVLDKRDEVLRFWSREYLSIISAK